MRRPFFLQLRRVSAGDNLIPSARRHAKNHKSRRVFNVEELERRDVLSGLSDAAYPLLNARVNANRTNFYVYQDGDSGFNTGFPSGFFGAINKIHINAFCIDDPNSPNGCAADVNRLDRDHRNVLSVSFERLVPGEFAGVNIEEPENWGSLHQGVGYDARTATRFLFDVRSPSPGGVRVQVGVGQRVTDFLAIPQSLVYTSMSIPLSSLKDPFTGLISPPDLSNVHVLFTVVTNDLNAPNGGTVLFDNVRFDSPPGNQQAVPSFPTSTDSFGVVPLQNRDPGRVPIPSDQVLRNLTTTYESALTILTLLQRRSTEDLASARFVADAFVYALRHDNHGDPLPPAIDGSVGLHNGYENGSLPLFNNQQPPKAGLEGDVRLAGFSASQDLCGPSKFCLVLDGATGGNNAFAMLALISAYRSFNDTRYLDAARTIGRWIVSNLADTTGTGYGGYYLGYPDEGKPKLLQRGKSIENNADIFASLQLLASVESSLGNTTQANEWTARAIAAGDFVIALFDPVAGRFYAGTVPVGTAASLGIDPSGPRRGNDVINTFDFLDSNTFATLALASSQRYRDRVDWRRPVQFVLSGFAQSVTAGGRQFQGFDIVKQPTSGPNGIAWEFTGQAIAAMRLVDALYQESRFDGSAAFYSGQLGQAQTVAPFGDGRGLVASTLQNGDMLRPLEQCLSTPFQCIPERVGLAATGWAIFADQFFNPLSSNPTVTALTVNVNPVALGQPVILMATVSSIVPGAGVPTGVVTFREGTTTLGTAAVNGGVGTFLFSTLSAGKHTVTAFYSGDPYFATSTSTPLQVSVGNPNERFVAQLYLDLLQRQADTPGLTNWSSSLERGFTRGQMAAAIINSVEYRTLVVKALYQRFLHRSAEQLGLDAFSSCLASGCTVEQVATFVGGSPEYFQIRAGGSNNGFLEMLYQDALHRGIDPSGRSVFGQALANGATRAQVAEAVFASDEYRQHLVHFPQHSSDDEFIRQQPGLVHGFYQHFLHRDADSAGLGFFIEALRRGARDEEVIAVIVGSEEYFALQ